jgi:hypothetical protein
MDLGQFGLVVNRIGSQKLLKPLCKEDRMRQFWLFDFLGA